MKGISASLTSVVSAVMLSFLFLFLTAGAGSAQEGEGCDVIAFLSAPGAGDTIFTFTGVNSGGGDFAFQLIDGGDTGGEIGQKASVEITFVPTDGWAFGGFECSTPGGLLVTNFDDGFSLECVDPNQGSAICTINLVRLSSQNIPTLSEWGMIAAAAGLGLVGVLFAVRRRARTV